MMTFCLLLSMRFKKKMTGNILESARYNPTECGKILKLDHEEDDNGWQQAGARDTTTPTERMVIGEK